MRLARVIGATLFLLVLLVATSAGVGLAARNGLLVIVAVPFAAVLVVVLRAFGPAVERAGWALFTAWLGTTYLQTGAGIETAVALGYVALGLVGAFAWPWAFVLAWAGHPFWDLVPRTLPPLLVDLPTACLFFDGFIAIYLAWAIWNERWTIRAPRLHPGPSHSASAEVGVGIVD